MKSSASRLILVALATVPLALAANSCAWWQWALGAAGGATLFATSRFNHMYTGPYRSDRVERLEGTTSEVQYAFVESDDFGAFHDRNQARTVLNSLETALERGNVSVIVYVHGWRHNAKEGDRDVEAFKYTLGYLGERLDEPEFRERRRQRTGRAQTTVFGIYLGWRGKMAPEMPPPLGYVNLPVYASFWNRKATAHVVGRGDIREFLLHLDDLHNRVNRPEGGTGSDRRRMSLVVIGHSFGGHIVFDAIRDRLEGHLFSAFDASGDPSSRLSDRVYPAPRGTSKVKSKHLVRGFGDLVVLINPAIEADVYRRMDDMIQAGEFLEEQTNVLVTISAENDWNRRRQFATARGMGLWGARKTSEQSPALVRALGSYGPQITHRLVLRDEQAETKQRASVKILEAAARKAKEARQGSPRVHHPGESILLASMKPLTGEEIAQKVITPTDSELVRLEPIRPGFENKPAIVVSASRDVISGHSDFFRVGFVSWLSSHVLAMQRKSLSQREELIQQAK